MTLEGAARNCDMAEGDAHRRVSVPIEYTETQNILELVLIRLDLKKANRWKAGSWNWQRQYRRGFLDIEHQNER